MKPEGAPLSPSVLVVDDDAPTRRSIEAWLLGAGMRVRTVSNGADALASLGDDVGAVCLDLGLDDIDGVTVLAALRRRRPRIPVIVLTSRSAPDAIVLAMKNGATDYLVKPTSPPTLVATITAALREAGPTVPLASAHRAGLVGDSPPIRELAAHVHRVARREVPVALFGETGSGKELVARWIHVESERTGPFVAVNCSAIPETLEETEFFGHERGAFTGATSLRKGKFELATGGTLFLDEIGEMAASTQAILLRTLQQQTIVRVGGAQEVPIDVRVVVATHRDLDEEVRRGRFRQDLFFRLVVYPISIPPLRRRKSDIAALAAASLRAMAAKDGVAPPSVSGEALELLQAYRWPGNVRELQNVLNRAFLLAEGQTIDVRHLPTQLTALPRLARGMVKEIAAGAIRAALAESGGSVVAAAQRLGVSRATLYRRLSALDDGES